jgi:hypothetical protein
MQPDPKTLLGRLGIQRPPIGLYDAPDPAPFAPLVAPKPGRHVCVFAFFREMMAGKTVHLTAESFGCGGAGRAWFSVQTRARDDYLRFLADEEGLKASTDLMGQWFDASPKYRPKHPHLLIGPLRPDQWEHLLTVTFFVEPDALAALTIGAQYHAALADPAPVIAPFGPGCGLMIPFEDLTVAQAAIGATDIAMRRFLPPAVMAFSATRPMFERLCSLDRRSFLFKPFLDRLMESRGTPGACEGPDSD